ncbi:MAG: hypothetical protein K9H64_02515 [Bacteroidales bacterium]|nr:hypothetical protein [Bacteroidales bacterium]MCF8454888.1 hypothetical protein [Bacteroidales bacterium]
MKKKKQMGMNTKHRTTKKSGIADASHSDTRAYFFKKQRDGKLIGN